jgi:hypothetical protein
MTKRRGRLGEVEWAYCEHCRRDVELLPVGRLAIHTTHTGEGWREEQCPGSLRRPGKPPRERSDND